jgi:4-hydroxy-tetrahydrodipicolinate synthase
MVYALFGADGRLSREGTRQQVRAMLRHGVQGVAVLGLASEVNKLSLAERRQLMEWVVEDVNGAVPVAVTVAEPNVAEQAAFTQAAKAAGAQWVILQPPPVRDVQETELICFFGAVAERSPLPVAVQNAPGYLGVGLSTAGLAALHRAHANVAILKVESSALAIGQLRDILGDEIDIFNGCGGIDMIDSLRAGAVGIIPGGECFDVLAAIFRDVSTEGGDQERATHRYASVLPMLVFLMGSMDTFLVYGKHVLRDRLGIGEIHHRLPFAPPTALGVQIASRYAAALGPL